MKNKKQVRRQQGHKLSYWILHSVKDIIAVKARGISVKMDFFFQHKTVLNYSQCDFFHSKEVCAVCHGGAVILNCFKKDSEYNLPNSLTSIMYALDSIRCGGLYSACIDFGYDKEDYVNKIPEIYVSKKFNLNSEKDLNLYLMNILLIGHMLKSAGL